MLKTVALPELYEVVNNLQENFFHGELPLENIHLEIEEDSGNWGWCVPAGDADAPEYPEDDIILGVVPEFDSAEHFVATVLHECVHAIQIYNDLPVGHEETTSWRAWQQDAKELMNIEI